MFKTLFRKLGPEPAETKPIDVSNPDWVAVGPIVNSFTSGRIGPRELLKALGGTRTPSDA